MHLLAEVNSLGGQAEMEQGTRSKALRRESTRSGIDVEYDSQREKKSTLNRSSVLLASTTESIKWLLVEDEGDGSGNKQ